MLIWFILALGSAISNSLVQATQKWTVAISQYSKITITFIATATSSALLFFVSYFLIGFPQIDPRFWVAVAVTTLINIISFPLMLKAYELGEFSSVYSMILSTPIFLLFTSIVFLGETASFWGMAGVALTVVGLWIVARGNHEHVNVPNFAKGNLLALSVAFLWSISVNFDKLSTIYSDRFFFPAVSLAGMAAGYVVYLLVRHKTLLVKTNQAEAVNSHAFFIPKVSMLILLGLVMAGSQVLHNSALLAGLASYTIAIKRMGVLFGIFWGWLFFHEKNIVKKLFGAAVAIGGVILILFS